MLEPQKRGSSIITDVPTGKGREATALPRLEASQNAPHTEFL